MLDGWGPPGEARTQQEGQLREWELPRALNLEKVVNTLMDSSRVGEALHRLTPADHIYSAH